MIRINRGAEPPALPDVRAAELDRVGAIATAHEP